MSKGIEFLFKKNKITLLKGSGYIKDRGRLEVLLEQGESCGIEADHIIVATGASPVSLPFAPIDGKRVISYREALLPERLPKSLAVIGSGAIGSEMAYFYSSMGVEVTIIEYLDRILPLEDEDVSAQISRNFRKGGIKVLACAKVTSVQKKEQGCVVTVETKRGVGQIETEQVLSAAGVVPNTGFLGLETLGIETVKGRIPVDEFYMTKVEGIYAIGDVIATPALAHVASAEAVAVVEKIAGLDVKPIDYSNVPSAIYTSPEAASVGITEWQAKERGLDYKIGKFPFTASGKTVEGSVVQLVKPLSPTSCLGITTTHSTMPC